MIKEVAPQYKSVNIYSRKIIPRLHSQLTWSFAFRGLKPLYKDNHEIVDAIMTSQ